MVEAAHIDETSAVLEIGPGKGVLTKKLLEHAGVVYAIEKDSELANLLRETFAEEIASERLVLIEGDVRDGITEKILARGPYTVAANIPYYITGEIIRSLLSSANQPETIALLIQKEVAQRIVAHDKKESLLSLSVKVYGMPRLVRSVPRGCFRPAPSVDSAILTIENISRVAFDDIDEEKFFTIAHAGFGSKRKMLAGNLKAIAPAEKILAAFAACSIDMKARAENVPIEKWLELVKQLG